MSNTQLNSAFDTEIKAVDSTTLQVRTLPVADGTLYTVCAQFYPVGVALNSGTVVSNKF